MKSQIVCTLLIARDQIDTAVKRLAGELNRDYRGKNPLMVGLLKGSFMFMADLVRQLDFPVEIDFARISSYGSGKETSGQVRIVFGPGAELNGRDIIVVEDVVDTGLTVAHFVKYLQKKHPASLKICVLADKPARRRLPVQIDYVGFTFPDKFLVGCGLDWDEKYRNLPDICVLEENE
jgi:hypoxanthine phosphoribosyltransferase